MIFANCIVTLLISHFLTTRIRLLLSVLGLTSLSRLLHSHVITIPLCSEDMPVHVQLRGNDIIYAHLCQRIFWLCGNHVIYANPCFDSLWERCRLCQRLFWLSVGTMLSMPTLFDSLWERRHLCQCISESLWERCHPSRKAHWTCKENKLF